MKCVVCAQRKGKRYCPAKSRHICANCCGEKRVLEINCPLDCEHLISGQTHQMLRKYVDQLGKEADPLRKRRFHYVTMRLTHVLSALEAEIVRFSAGLRVLKDPDVREAVHLLTKTYQTEKSGLIYEHRSTNLLIQSLILDLQAALEKLRNNPPDGVPRLRLEDILDTLDVMSMNIEYHLQAEPESDGYLRFIKRNHPQAAVSDGKSGGLIVEGLS